MLELVIMTAGFLGIVGASCKFLNLDPGYAPLFSISLIGILLFFFALAGFLETGTYLVAGLGGGFALYFVAGRIKKTEGNFTPSRFLTLKPGTVFGGLIVLSFCLTFNMQFTVVDDFVFWGIAGKYLVLFDHLPRADTTIIAKHLMYTPGTSLVHYFFHGLTGAYKPSFAYFAQNMILISALFVVIRKQQMEKSLIRLCLMVVLLTLFSGSVFTKLQVDYLLTTLFFAVLWIYYTDDNLFPKLLAISAPICFLFLIKQIGLLLGLLLLVIIAADLIFNGNPGKQLKFKALGFLFLIGGFLLLLNRLWAWHCLEMGFTAFNNAMTLDNILAALNIFSDETIQKGFLIYVKAVFLGPADRFNLPYLFWYVLLVFIGIRLFRGMSPEENSRFGLLAKMMTIAFILYLVMIYFFQVIVFRVGANYDHTVGLTRYLNILFAQIIIFTFLFSVGRLWFKKPVSGKALLIGVIGVTLIFGISRIEKTIRPDNADIQAESLAQKIVLNTDRNRQNRICVIPGNKDQFLGIKLLYHLLPDRVNPDPFPAATREQFMDQLVQWDYVLFYQPDNRVKAWAEKLTNSSLGPSGFYEIMALKAHSLDKKESVTLRKLF